MPTPGSKVQIFSGQYDAPPAGAPGHLRATCPTGDRLLSSCLAAAKFPSSTSLPARYPVAVHLVVELADAANLTYVTYDGTATAAANTNGIRVPVEPNTPLRIPYSAGMNSDAGTIRVCATIGTAHLQCFFEY